MAKGTIKQVGRPGQYKYFLSGQQLDLTDTKKMLELVENSDFEEPKGTRAAALNFSSERAKAVRQAVIDYAKSKAYRLQESQFKTEGVGVAEPVIARPKNMEEAKLNMRVEFRIMKTAGGVAEATSPDVYDY